MVKNKNNYRDKGERKRVIYMTILTILVFHHIYFAKIMKESRTTFFYNFLPQLRYMTEYDW